MVPETVCRRLAKGVDCQWGSLRRARRGVSGRAASSDGARGAWLVRAARDGHGAPAQGSRTWHSSELALRVFACARGRTRSFHAVCVEKGMRGAGRACIGVWEFGVCPEGVMVPEGRSLHAEVNLFKKKR